MTGEEIYRKLVEQWLHQHGLECDEIIITKKEKEDKTA